MSYLVDDTRGISPAVTLIAIVAITIVVLAGIFGGLLGGQFGGGETQPEMTVEFDNTLNENITITHVEGDSVDPEKIEITYQPLNSSLSEQTVYLSDVIAENSSSPVRVSMSGDEFSAGDSIIIPTDDVRLIWVAQESDETLFIGQYP